MFVEAHKNERAWHTEIYSLRLKVQHKPTFKLPLDMVSKHAGGTFVPLII